MEDRSTWGFVCSLGLPGGACGNYRQDTDSRGYRFNIGGCPSCTHRVARNTYTAQDETYYRQLLISGTRREGL